MSIPDYQTLMLPVLTAASEGEVQVGKVVEQLADQLGLTPEQRAELQPSGKQTVFYNRVNWAKFFLKRAGLLEDTSFGHFKITPLGQKVLGSHPKHIDNAFLAQFPEFKEFQQRSTQSFDPGQPEPKQTTSTPDEIMRAAHDQIETALAQDLLDKILAAPPAFFEKLIVKLLLEMKYGESATSGRVLGRSGDGGVDGVVDQDALGLDRVYIQAKRYKRENNVGVSAIKEFFGSLETHKAVKGVFVTTSDFTGDARKNAESFSKRIVLIGGEQLAKLMMRYQVGCRNEETLHIKKIDEDFFE